MRYIIDRIEDGFAVLEAEDLSHMELPAEELPAGAKEGSVIEFDGDRFELNERAEEERRKRILELQNKLKKRR